MFNSDMENKVWRTLEFKDTEQLGDKLDTYVLGRNENRNSKEEDGRKGKVQRSQWDTAGPVQAAGHRKPWPGDFENEYVAVPVGWM